MSAGGSEAVLLKVGLGIVERAAPAGLAVLRSWWRGKKVLVLGQARSGKTTFIDYLRYGVFEDEKDTFKTKDVTPSASFNVFNVSLGRDKALELTHQTVVDVPGQVGPVAHANLAFTEQPHAIVIFTDLTTPLDGEEDRACGAWLTEFCKQLEMRWRSSGRKNRRLRAMIVVQNKRDKAAKGADARYAKAMRKILDAHLRDGRGAMTEDVAIMPCVMVTNRNKTKAVDAVIVHLAKELAKCAGVNRPNPRSPRHRWRNWAVGWGRPAPRCRSPRSPCHRRRSRWLPAPRTMYRSSSP